MYLLCSLGLIALVLCCCASEPESNPKNTNLPGYGKQPIASDTDATKPSMTEEVLNSTRAEIETIQVCLDYDSYHKIYVDRVLSSNQVQGLCGDMLVIVDYTGVSDEIYDIELKTRAVSLNKFLVLDKNVNMQVHNLSLVEGTINIQAELFVGGESVTGRLISSGLVKLDFLPQNFQNKEVFQNYQKEAEKRQLGIWKGIRNQLEQDTSLENAKNTVPPLGCGTLPCKPVP